MSYPSSDNQLDLNDDLPTEKKRLIAIPADENTWSLSAVHSRPSSTYDDGNSSSTTQYQNRSGRSVAEVPEVKGPCEVCSTSQKIKWKFAYSKIHYDKKEKQLIRKIGCAHCHSTFHIGCVGVQPYELLLIEQYACEACRTNGGHTIKRTIAQNDNFSMKIGCQYWINNFLVKKEFTPVPLHKDQTMYGVIEMKDGEEFKNFFDPKIKWNAIYLINLNKDLGLTVPDKDCDLQKIVELMRIDASSWLDVVNDVTAQQSTYMFLDRLCELFDNKERRERAYNCISINYSSTGLAEIVSPPWILDQLSLAESHWPQNRVSEQKPDVERFLLVSMDGSYTDFHIDFGGSSVWFYLHTGQKDFFLAPPTEKNLHLFQEHRMSSYENQEQSFLGDSLESVWKFSVHAGQTVIFPAGYIHGVHTSVDSIAFSGSFLTMQGMEMHHKVYKMETVREVSAQFRYPNFNGVMFHTANALAKKFNEFRLQRETENDVPDGLDGAIALADCIKTLMKEEKNAKTKKTKQNIFKRLEKEIKLVKRYEEVHNSSEDDEDEDDLDDFGMADAEGENPENVITEREVIPASSIPLEKYGKPTGKRKNSAIPSDATTPHKKEKIEKQIVAGNTCPLNAARPFNAAEGVILPTIPPSSIVTPKEKLEEEGAVGEKANANLVIPDSLEDLDELRKLITMKDLELKEKASKVEEKCNTVANDKIIVTNREEQAKKDKDSAENEDLMIKERTRLIERLDEQLNEQIQLIEKERQADREKKELGDRMKITEETEKNTSELTKMNVLNKKQMEDKVKAYEEKKRMVDKMRLEQ